MYRQPFLSGLILVWLLTSATAYGDIRSERDQLHQFRGGPTAQVAKGYDFELLDYRIHTEDEDGLHGHFWVHIHLNRNWWSDYYALSRSLASPMLRDTVRDGPLTILGSGRRTEIGVASGEQIPLHPDFADAIARRVPLTLQVGNHRTDIELHRNLLIADFASEAILLDAHASQLECGHSRHAACGHQFVVGIPFTEPDQKAIRGALEQGLRLWYTPLTQH